MTFRWEVGVMVGSGYATDLWPFINECIYLFIFNTLLCLASNYYPNPKMLLVIIIFLSFTTAIIIRYEISLFI